MLLVPRHHLELIAEGEAHWQLSGVDAAKRVLAPPFGIPPGGHLSASSPAGGGFSFKAARATPKLRGKK
ncbi:hypothetical protein FRX31_032120 [Thalictrum thalictroides]|uniref:Uncharacterized protein n=1 Tax=Thalictrum thalictroides TaxID=46969 RepID=A0A7J6V067_THATH|nr:hypothetical protein FRX31_032120 [Thalictrum thalictroides]